MLHRSSENDRVLHGEGALTTESTMALAVDLSKAFDSINHNLLLAKLKAYGLSQSALSLMSSYLLGRKQRVCLHGVCSSYSELRAGPYG